MCKVWIYFHFFGPPEHCALCEKDVIIVSRYVWASKRTRNILRNNKYCSWRTSRFTCIRNDSFVMFRILTFLSFAFSLGNRQVGSIPNSTLTSSYSKTSHFSTLLVLYCTQNSHFTILCKASMHHKHTVLHTLLWRICH